MSSTLHAHIDTASADCDGPLYDSWVETFNADEIAESLRAYFNGVMLGYGEPVNDFSDIHFMNRVFVGRCGPYAVGQMRITMDEDGFEYYENTEEGYRSGEVRWCTDDCDTGERSHRDVYAESMGY